MSTEAADGAAVWPEGYDRLILGETDSTMAEARRRAGSRGGPVWIMARRQSAAHGRRGRVWAMAEGNFAATLLMQPGCPPAEAALRSFTAAVALHQALSLYIAPERLALKWPNDLLLDGGKIAGILLESSGRAGLTDWLAIGIGVNLVAAPGAGDVEPGATLPVSLAGQGDAVPAPEDFLTALASAYAALEAQFAAYGFAPIRRLWLGRAARLGQTVTARLPGAEIAGTFETVDEAGHLILSTEAGRQAIAAAEVHFRRV